MNNYADWFRDSEPCLINIKMQENTLLIPKIKWETGDIEPKIDNEIVSKVISILQD